MAIGDGIRLWDLRTLRWGLAWFTGCSWERSSRDHGNVFLSQLRKRFALNICKPGSVSFFQMQQGCAECIHTDRSKKSLIHAQRRSHKFGMVKWQVLVFPVLWVWLVAPEGRQRPGGHRMVLNSVVRRSVHKCIRVCRVNYPVLTVYVLVVMLCQTVVRYVTLFFWILYPDNV